MLKESRGTHYDKKLKAAVALVKGKGFDEIRASIDPYENPKPIVSKNSDLAFIPDITARKKGGKAYFEISKRGEDVDQVAGKWQLLQVMANLRNGVFKIFVPKGSMQFTQRLVNKYNIRAELVKI